MYRKVLVAFLLSLNCLWAQTIVRPISYAVSSSTAPGCANGTNVTASPTNPGNMYDTTNPPPNSTYGSISITSGSHGISSYSNWNQVILSWPSTVNNFTSLTLNLSSACSIGGTGGSGDCLAFYYDTTTSTWMSLIDYSGVSSGQSTTSLSIPRNITFSGLKVSVCTQSGYYWSSVDDQGYIGGATFTIWDVWVAAYSQYQPNTMEVSINHRFHFPKDLMQVSEVDKNSSSHRGYFIFVNKSKLFTYSKDNSNQRILVSKNIRPSYIIQHDK